MWRKMKIKGNKINKIIKPKIKQKNKQELNSFENKLYCWRMLNKKLGRRER